SEGTQKISAAQRRGLCVVWHTHPPQRGPSPASGCAAVARILPEVQQLQKAKDSESRAGTSKHETRVAAGSQEVPAGVAPATRISGRRTRPVGDFASCDRLRESARSLETQRSGRYMALNALRWTMSHRKRHSRCAHVSLLTRGTTQ